MTNNTRELVVTLDLQFFAGEPDTGGGFPTFEQFQSSLEGGSGISEPTGDEGNFAPPLEGGNSDNGQTEQAPMTAAEMHRIKYMGQEQELTYDELVQKAQMGFDYTQKMQQFSQEKQTEMQRIQQEAQRIQQLEQQYAEAIQFYSGIQQDPNLAQYLSQAYESYYQGGQFNPYQAQPQAPIDITQFPEFQTVQQQLNEITKQREIENVDRQWKSLLQEYPDAKDVQMELINKAIELDQAGVKENALEIAYFMVNGKNLKQNAQREVVEKSMSKQVAKTQIPGGGGAGAQQPTAKPKTFDEIKKFLQQQNGN